MEGLKVDLSDETVRLLLARRKRIQNPFTDHIVKETDRLKEEARKNVEKGIKSPKKEKQDSIEDGDDGRIAIETEF